MDRDNAKRRLAIISVLSAIFSRIYTNGAPTANVHVSLFPTLRSKMFIYPSFNNSAKSKFE